jgi:hypothetical protein
MKTKLTLLLSLLFILNCQAQTYNFSVASNTYSNLTGNTSLNNGITWDDPNFAIPIGFSFQYYNTTFSTIYITDEGTGGALTTSSVPSGVLPAMIPFWNDLIDRGYDLSSGSSTGSLSNLSYKTEGVVGSRILKIEWNNAGFFYDLDGNGSSSDFVNFQLWLYETTNVFQVRFGPSSITYPSDSFEGETGPAIGFFPSVNFNTGDITVNGIVLSGLTSNPTVNNTTDQLFLNGMPSNGTTYIFTPSSLGLNNFEKNDLVRLYPNPIHDTFAIDNKDKSVEIKSVKIMDTNGRLIKEFSDLEELNIGELNNGIYFAIIQTEKGQIIKKIIKS